MRLLFIDVEELVSTNMTSSLSIGVTSLSSFAFFDVMSLSTGVLSGQNHQAIDKTPVDNDTSKKAKLNNEVTPMDNDDDVVYLGKEFWTFSTDLLVMSISVPFLPFWCLFLYNMCFFYSSVMCFFYSSFMCFFYSSVMCFFYSSFMCFFYSSVMCFFYSSVMCFFYSSGSGSVHFEYNFYLLIVKLWRLSIIHIQLTNKV